MSATATRRICAHPGCDTILSAYNEDDRCALHELPEPDPPSPKRRFTFCANETCAKGPRKASDLCPEHHAEREQAMQATAEANNGATAPHFPEKDCEGCGNSFAPTGPRSRFCSTCAADRKRASTRRSQQRGVTRPATPAKPKPTTAEGDPRRRYVAVLIAAAESAPSEDLFDRIEAQLEALA